MCNISEVKVKIHFRRFAQMILSRLLDSLCDAEIPSEICSYEIRTISHRADTRFDGGMFIALRGQKEDGNRYAAQAVQNGAGCIVTDGELPAEVGVPVIRVANARFALAHIWSAYYGHPEREMDMIAITGTNGKTTTAYLLSAILQTAGYRTGRITTVDGSLTTPDPEELYRTLRTFADNGKRATVMEASSHALYYGKLHPIRYHSAVFTNLTPEHLDFHGTMEAYRDAKAILFGQCDRAYFNYDDPHGQVLYGNTPCEKYYYSAKDVSCYYHASHIRDCGQDGVWYHLFGGDRIVRLHSSIPGSFTVYNTLAAACCALGMGIEPLTVSRAVAELHGVPGRMERVALPDEDYAVFIDFAHTPDALEKLLCSVRAWLKKEQRLVVLFGCGGDRDPSKRPAMGAIATRLADRTVFTSDNSRSEDPASILEQILQGADPNADYAVIPDRREAIRHCVMNAQAGDVILLCGKGHETYEITSHGKLPFCERDIVLQSAQIRNRRRERH